MIRPLRELEKEAILSAILEAGSITSAALKLKIGRSTIHRLMHRYNIALKVNEILAELKKQRKLL